MGVLEHIWIKRFKGGPMDAVTEAQLDTGEGLRGNADRGGKRQLTLLERERWDALQLALGVSGNAEGAHRRRANLLVSGCDLADTRGRVLCIGECRVLIHGETKPCHQMDEVVDGLRSAMFPNWGGGAFGEVLAGGSIRIGDRVAFE